MKNYRKAFLKIRIPKSYSYFSNILRIEGIKARYKERILGFGAQEWDAHLQI